ncbi:hypothetical protein S40288_10776 [Stachybotrys chartarum IBT 40288]|nr:hypothetical protein S40288_10776 [Stachybotrys chartarum IBT 40288]
MYEGLCTEDVTGTCGPSPQSPSNVGNRAIVKLAGQKRQLQKDDTDGEKDTEAADSAKRSKISKRAKTETNLKSFACPYFKYDPKRFGKHRTCCGPGFKDLNRLKEHLKRQHRSFECNRCYELFHKEEKLERHQRQSKPCAVKERSNASRNYGDGYDQAQEKELKKRLKADDEAKWAAWYRVLFCIDAKSPEVPSPYFEDSESKTPSSKSLTCGKHQSLSEHVRRVYPRLVLALITEEVERATVGIEGKARLSIQNRLPDIAFKLKRLFQNIQPPSVQGDDADNDTEPSPPAAEDVETDFFKNLEDLQTECFDFSDSGYLDAGPTDYSSLLSYTDTSNMPLLSSTSGSSFDILDGDAFGRSGFYDPPRPY